MKPTNGDKLFFDTNVLLYLTSNDESKSCIASAIDAGCTLVMTEDFQHGQMFERRIRVCNPFAATA